MPRFASARACFVILLAIPASATGATSESQAWMTQSAAVRADKATTVMIDLSQRGRSDSRSGGEQLLQRLSVDHRIAPGVDLGGGLTYVWGESEQEMRLHQQIVLTRGILLLRTRMEQRFFDTADEASWRLRQRVQMALPIDAAKRWTLIAATEFFFHLNRARPSDKTGLATMRQQIGLRHPLTPAIDAQLLYMRQQNFRDARPDAVAHIPWLTLSWRL